MKNHQDNNIHHRHELEEEELSSSSPTTITKLTSSSTIPPNSSIKYLDASNRLPTSIQDQIRQAIISLQRASQDGKHRHHIQLIITHHR